MKERLSRYLENNSCSCKTLTAHTLKLNEIHDGMSGNIGKLAKFLKILAEPNRLKILYLLKENSYCLCELEYILDLSQPTITHHVKKLKNVGLIRLEKDGRWTSSVLIQPEIIDILDSMDQIIKSDI